jgi:HAD superfamily hydrolase (TIGR01509 family)
MSSESFIKVAFFDLGGTLVLSQRDWIPGAQETLAKLRDKRVRLGLISNTNDLLRPAILNLLPVDFDLGLFDDELIIFSSEVHVAKPDPEIFRLAIRRANVSPGECLFCTEELSHVLVAKQEGMNTITVRKPPDSDIRDLVAKLTSIGLLPV